MGKEVKEDDLSGLSDEERASLAELDDGDDPTEQDATDEVPEAAKDDAAGDDLADNVKADDAAEPVEDSGESNDTQPEHDSADDGQAPPAIPALPEGYAAQVEALNQQYEGLGQQFEDGELSMPQLLAQQRTINDQMVALREQKLRTDLAEEQANMAWQAANEAFFSANPDYAADKSRVLFGAMQAAIQEVNEQAESPMSYARMMAKAKERVDAAFGRVTGTPAAAAPAKPRLVSDRAGLPPTLNKAPAAAASEVGSSEFAHLENLEGMEYEAGVAKLTPEQQERWARQG